jgi:hypothetical protein
MLSWIGTPGKRTVFSGKSGNSKSYILIVQEEKPGQIMKKGVNL